jgi:hypothetical protein
MRPAISPLPRGLARRALLLATLALCCLGQAAADEAPSAVEMRRIPLLGHSAPVPLTWVEQRPETDMRLAQFNVRGATEAEDAEAVVFYFGRVGRAENNIRRWESQFAAADGSPVKARIDHLTVDGMVVTTAELSGSYARGIGMGPIGDFKPDRMLLAAVIETSRGNIIIQLHGPAATVREHRTAFEAMVRGFRVGEARSL